MQQQIIKKYVVKLYFIASIKIHIFIQFNKNSESKVSTAIIFTLLNPILQGNQNTIFFIFICAEICDYKRSVLLYFLNFNLIGITFLFQAKPQIKK